MLKTKFPAVRKLRIAEQRIRCGFSQAALALRLGLSQEVLSYYETGQRDIPVSTLYAIALQLHISPRDLFPDEEVALDAHGNTDHR